MERIVTACVLIIGNEILSGRTQDANLAHIAQTLNEAGVRVTEARVIPVDEDVIVNTVNEVRQRFDYVFTTGGIGPTHDDITAECIARAFGVPLEMHPEIEAMIRQRPAPEDVMNARLRMARVPKGAQLVDNPLAGPPGFQIENVFVMAGIPSVMRGMLSTVGDRLEGGRPVRSRAVTVHLGESQVADDLRAIDAAHPDVDLGSYPFYRNDVYGTSLVMRGTDEAELDAMAEEVRAMARRLGAEPIDGEPE